MFEFEIKIYSSRKPSKVYTIQYLFFVDLNGIEKDLDNYFGKKNRKYNYRISLRFSKNIPTRVKRSIRKQIQTFLNNASCKVKKNPSIKLHRWGK